MLKINLLPPYINQRKQVRVAIVIVALLVAAEIATLVVMRNGPIADKNRLSQEKSDKEGKLAQLTQVGTASTTVLAEEGTFKPTVDFFRSVEDFNKQHPNLYQNTARYTFSEIMFLNLEAQQTQLQASAYASNPTHVSRMLIGLSRSPDFQGLPQITGLPQYSEAEAAQREQANNAADLPGSTIMGGYGGPGPEGDGAAGMPGGPGMGGYPGMGGPMGGMGAGMRGPMGGMGAGMGGPMGGMGAGMGGGAMGGMGAGMGGMGGGMGGGGGDLSKLGMDNARLKPKGFTITITCALTKPLSGLAYGGTGGGGGGMMGGMGGMMGGMGGAMGGGPMAGGMSGMGAGMGAGMPGNGP